MSSSVKQSSKTIHNHDYEEALIDIGSVLSRYDADNMYCVYGFGCQPDLKKYPLLRPEVSVLHESEFSMIPDVIPEEVQTEVAPMETVQEEVTIE